MSIFNLDRSMRLEKAAIRKDNPLPDRTQIHFSPRWSGWAAAAGVIQSPRLTRTGKSAPSTAQLFWFVLYFFYSVLKPIEQPAMDYSFHPRVNKLSPASVSRHGNRRGKNRPNQYILFILFLICVGGLLLVATVYSYDTAGNQIFMISVGPVDGDTAEVDVYITEGGLWGDGFDPALVTESQWGNGTFRSCGCGNMVMDLRPNSQYQTEGYTSLLNYKLVRLTLPALPCPIDHTN